MDRLLYIALSPTSNPLKHWHVPDARSHTPEDEHSVSSCAPSKELQTAHNINITSCPNSLHRSHHLLIKSTRKRAERHPERADSPRTIDREVTDAANLHNVAWRPEAVIARTLPCQASVIRLLAKINYYYDMWLHFLPYL